MVFRPFIFDVIIDMVRCKPMTSYLFSFCPICSVMLSFELIKYFYGSILSPLLALAINFVLVVLVGSLILHILISLSSKTPPMDKHIFR